MNKLEQAARALLAHWDTPAWKYLKPTGDLMADLREALAEPKRYNHETGSVLIPNPLAEQAEQEPVSLHKVVEEHIADLRACVPTLRQYPEMASMTREVIKAANELEAALKSEQAEQEPVAWMNTNGAVNKLREAGWAMNAAPVRTKDLTDDEIDKITAESTGLLYLDFARAVIAADREKNK